MDIIHAFNGTPLRKEVPDGEFSFFLSNGYGGFVHFATESSSKYQGFFVRLDSSGLFKVLESLEVEGEDRITAVENAGHYTAFRRSRLLESFFMPQGMNSIVCQFNKKLPVGLFLDVRRANDFRQWGRNYSSYENGGCLVVEFTKKTDAREDSGSGNAEYSIFIAVKHDGVATRSNGEWVRRSYSLDAKRNSASERYVYKAATISAGIIVVSAAASAAEAVEEAGRVFKSVDRLKAESRRHCNGLCKSKSPAVNAAAIALGKLAAKSGMYAGLPWFFQEWSRDELVSCVALPASARKKVVLKYLDRILDDGRLPNLIGSPSASADSVGWLFKRASGLHDEGKFTAAELKRLKAGLKKCIDCLLQRRSRNGFIMNGKNETWMDTAFNDDGRAGACIEIQAMQLNMYNLMHRLSGEKTYLLLENSLRQNVRKFFWDCSMLADRLGDFTVRPNIFIAAYVYPWLLSKKEWETCIGNVLRGLWLDWGGLATIDKSHQNFRSSYTGETNESYHRGDSWFWLNNLAAIVMTKLNKKKFKSYIEKIAAAGIDDILWKGAIGCGSELSSAKEQLAEGCLNQAWSNATFIEFMKLLHG